MIPRELADDTILSVYPKLTIYTGIKLGIHNTDQKIAEVRYPGMDDIALSKSKDLRGGPGKCFPFGTQNPPLWPSSTFGWPLIAASPTL